MQGACESLLMGRPVKGVVAHCCTGKSNWEFYREDYWWRTINKYEFQGDRGRFIPVNYDRFNDVQRGTENG